jgi:hypothetical protein
MVKRVSKMHGYIPRLVEKGLRKAPKPSRGFYHPCKELKPAKAWLIVPVDEMFAYSQEIMVAPSEVPTAG